MIPVLVRYGQCMLDIAIQEYGSAAALFDLAQDNNMEVDDDVFTGQVLQIREVLPDTADSAIVAYYKRNNIKVTSGTDQVSIEVLATNDDEILGDNNNSGLQV